ncbi:biopolymer transporter ExbD [Nitratireductor basaltis]|uniref:Biopolymer transport protein ExbD/TolR n=1 Tax=Nitratireductor basaltis TaxID=472175 RepID=A0A084UA31_9HYPH|nr:biopolymer transporter ExbD [Nitratireductor basaltis]KFB09817.1 Biopolymer transport protein ExbD/TolR [Nitratireductor basaltis]
MRIDTPVRRRRPIGLTSLIDVIFLLLLFFMLSSSFTRFAQVEMTAGRQGASASPDRPDVIIRLMADGWQINGVTVAAEEAIARLADLQAAGAEKAALTLRGEVTSQALIDAVEAINTKTQLQLTVAN